MLPGIKKRATQSAALSLIKLKLIPIIDFQIMELEIVYE